LDSQGKISVGGVLLAVISQKADQIQGLDEVERGAALLGRVMGVSKEESEQQRNEVQIELARRQYACV
jgi:hypothetical protein